MLVCVCGGGGGGGGESRKEEKKKDENISKENEVKKSVMKKA